MRTVEALNLRGLIEKRIVDGFGDVLVGDQIEVVLRSVSSNALYMTIYRNQLEVEIEPGVENGQGRIFAKNMASYLVEQYLKSTSDESEEENCMD